MPNMTELLDRLTSARDACAAARTRVETNQAALGQRSHERDQVETRIRRAASADDLDATRAARLDREALDYIIQSLEPQLESAVRDERAAQDGLREVTQEVSRWRASIEQFEASLQPGGELDRDYAEAEQRHQAAEQELAALEDLRARRAEQVAEARELLAGRADLRSSAGRGGGPGDRRCQAADRPAG
jgi:chromosome segregation ATPase